MYIKRILRFIQDIVPDGIYMKKIMNWNPFLSRKLLETESIQKKEKIGIHF